MLPKESGYSLRGIGSRSPRIRPGHGRVTYYCVVVARVADNDGQEKQLHIGDRVGALRRELPLQPEIPFESRVILPRLR